MKREKYQILKVFVGSKVTSNQSLELTANSKVNTSKESYKEFSGVARAFEMFVPSEYKKVSISDTPHIFQRIFHLESDESDVRVDVEVNFAHETGFSKEKFLVGDSYFSDWMEALYSFKYQLVKLTH